MPFPAKTFEESVDLVRHVFSRLILHFHVSHIA